MVSCGFQTYPRIQVKSSWLEAFGAYRRAYRDANIEIRRSKRRFETKLAANITDDVKSFYAYVSSKRKAKPRVGPIVTENGDMVSSPSCIAGLLNDYF